MFKKILIAGRGEAACRIVGTARRMGIATVAAYSEADVDAPHVEMADQAVRIDPAPERFGEAIVAAARSSGADAVHPGYATPAESAALAGALAKAVIAVIGSRQAVAATSDRPPAGKISAGARRIEIQVIGDQHGNIVHLGERECSIRHGRILITEAPSPFLDGQTRAALGEEAVRLARLAGLEGAGTVEFVVDENREFHSLAIDARLTAEHPVSELVTGLDLVEQTIRVAAGEKLALKQSDVRPRGWALMAHVNAEDPGREFVPSTGRLVRFHLPPAGKRGPATMRIDTGAYEGAEILGRDDPAIAKLCAHAPTREDAIEVVACALDEFVIIGVDHNIAFLNAILHHRRFRSGRLAASFVAEEYPDGFQGRPLDAAAKRRFAAAAVVAKLACAPGGPLQTADSLVAALDGDELTLSEARLCEGRFGARVEDEEYSAAADWRPGQPIMRLHEREREYAVQIARAANGYRLSQGGMQALVAVRSPRAAELASFMAKKKPPDGSKRLLCPMPGLVVSVNVAVGQRVKVGEPLAVVEAMKMENVLRAERDGMIGKINAKPGDNLALNDVILEFA